MQHRPHRCRPKVLPHLLESSTERAFFRWQAKIIGAGFVSVSGKASLLTDFANKTINGNLTQMVTTGFEGNKDPWNSVSVSGTLSGNTFAGTSAVISTPGT